MGCGRDGGALVSGRAALILLFVIVLLFALGPQVAADVVKAIVGWVVSFVTEVTN